MINQIPQEHLEKITKFILALDKDSFDIPISTASEVTGNTLDHNIEYLRKFVNLYEEYAPERNEEIRRNIISRLLMQNLSDLNNQQELQDLQKVLEHICKYKYYQCSQQELAEKNRHAKEYATENEGPVFSAIGIAFLILFITAVASLNIGAIGIVVMIAMMAMFVAAACTSGPRVYYAIREEIQKIKADKAFNQMTLELQIEVCRFELSTKRVDAVTAFKDGPKIRQKAHLCIVIEELEKKLQEEGPSSLSYDTEAKSLVEGYIEKLGGIDIIKQIHFSLDDLQKLKEKQPNCYKQLRATDLLQPASQKPSYKTRFLDKLSPIADRVLSVMRQPIPSF